MSAVALVLEVFGASYGPAAVLATGAAVVITAGVVIYNVSQNRSRQRLEAALSEQEEQA